MSNISLILSREKLTYKNLKYLGVEAGIHLHKVLSRMGESLQVVLPDTQLTNSDSLYIQDPRLLLANPPTKLIDKGDILEFKVKTGMPSVLMLSQKFHHAWKAQVLTSHGWIPTHTIEVNGAFQGALLPADALRVRLEFKPWVRFAWIAHIFWALLFCLLILNAWEKSRKESRNTSIMGFPN